VDGVALAVGAGGDAAGAAAVSACAAESLALASVSPREQAIESAVIVASERTMRM
jgi:hypothetical protein